MGQDVEDDVHWEHKLRILHATQVYTLRVEVQRLQVKIQEAEARAVASQRVAEEAQRELQVAVAAGTSPVASQARQAIDADKAVLRQQLMVSRPARAITEPLSWATYWIMC